MTIYKAVFENIYKYYTKKAHNNLSIVVLINVLLLFLVAIPGHCQPVLKDILSNRSPYNSFLNIQLPPDVNSINTLFQDERGLLWIGTKKGIFYYDGYDTHKLAVTAEATSYNVTSILQLDEKHLCIGTFQGLLLFNLFTEQYDTLYPGMEAIQSATAMCLFNKKLWIGTPEGSVCYYDFDQQCLHEFSSEKKEENKIIHVLEATNDKLYIGSYKGLSAYNPLTNTIKDIPFPSPKDQSMITSLAWDKEENCIWVGTETNFFCYSKKDESMVAFPLPIATPIESLKLDKQHNILIGTINGLYVYNKTSRQTHHLIHSSRNNQSLCNNLILCCYIDNNNNTWLGTGNGISLASYNPIYQQTHISELTGNDIGNQFSVLYKDSRENYWLGGKNGLIVKTAGNDIRWYHIGSSVYPLKHNQIRQIYEDPAHDIWLATDGGIAKYNPSTQQFIFYTIIDNSRKRSARWAYDIKQDPQGRLWIATYIGGLFVVDKAKLLQHDASTPYVAKQNFSSETSFTDNIYLLVLDKDNNIWGNTENGLTKIDTQKDTFTPFECYPNQMVYDGNEYLWFSNYNKIYRYNLTTQKEEKIYELPDENGRIYSLVMAENLIGFSSTEGITYLDRNTGEIQHFNLSKNNYEAGLFDVSLNRVLWGGNDMLISFPLRNLYLKNKSVTTTVQIIDIYSNNKKLIPTKDYEGVSVRYQNNITLPYSNQNIEIAIATLSYTTENSNIFYRLHNQKNWSKLPPTQNTITFANLRPDKYTLEIRNGSSPDPAHSSYTRFFIRILPPWYTSVTAYSAYTLALVTLLFFIGKNIRLRLKRKYEKVERNLDLSNMKMDFFLHISRELKKPLNLIITPVASLIEEIRNDGQKHQLEIVYKNALRLNTLIKNILDVKQIDYEQEDCLNKSQTELCILTQSILECFTDTFKEKEVEVTFTCNPSKIWLEVDVLKIELALLSLFSCIEKHAGKNGGKLEITLSGHEKEITLQLSDKGSDLLKWKHASGLLQRFSRKKIQPEIIGLYNIERYIALHGGSIRIFCETPQDDGKKTNSIIITLPEENSVEYILPTQAVTPPTATGDINASTILIVCDNPEELSFLTETLSHDFTILTALSGKDGLDIARQQLPDLILIDIPETGVQMGGLKYAKTLRHDQPTASIPLLMLTLDTDKETELRSIKASVDIFMPKPFDVTSLKLRIHQLLQMRRSLEKKIRVEQITSPVKVEISAPNGDEIFLSHITTLIEKEIENTEFNVSMLSELSKTDKKQLYRKLKRFTGFTPVEYIHHIRMKKAAMLLSSKNLSVSEVMYKVGFSNASYFARCFVAEFGMTPTQYMATENH